jgi:UDP-glucose 4-epimerase
VKTVFLTGGSGFIGRNISSSWIAQKYEILAPTHRELEIDDDDQVRSFLRSHHVDVVIHTASKPSHRNAPDPTRVFFANARMFLNLTRNADCFGKLLVTGSGAIYDVRHYRPMMQEDSWDEHVPVDEHGFSRFAIMRWIDGATFPCVDMRIFGIFGPHEDYAIRFISNAICKTLFDMPITLRQNRRFSYLWIEDFLKILARFIEEEVPDRAYNLTPDDTVELVDLAYLVRRIAGSSQPVIVAKEGLGPEYTGDNSRLRRVLGDIHFTPIETAVERLYGWYRDRRDTINRDFLLVDK